MSKELFQPVDAEARALARQLIDTADHAALGVIDPDSGGPVVTRIGVGTAPDHKPVALISDLAGHTAALRVNPACSLLLGEVGEKGSPLTHPRLTLTCTALFVARDNPARDALRAHFLVQRPKAKLFADFPDFHFVRFEINGGFLNGGFGRAFRLTPRDLGVSLGGDIAP